MNAIPVSDSTIRPAGDGDRASILEVARASGLFSPQDMGQVEAALDAFLGGAAGGGSDGNWLVDGAASGPAAVAYYAPEPMTSGTWNLYLLAVHPDHQRQGRGAALVRHIERDLRARGTRLLLIETSGVPAFTGQRALYTGLGYREQARIPEFYDAGDDKVVYGKTLTPADRPPLPAPAAAGPPPGVTLRAADGADLADLLELAQAFYAEDGFSTPAGQLARHLELLLGARGTRVAVVEADRQILGFAITTTSFGLKDGLIAELEDLYVRPECRRRGLAGRLIDDSAAWARSRGAAHLEVVTAPNGRDVSHLNRDHEARGFADHGRHPQPPLS